MAEATTPKMRFAAVRVAEIQRGRADVEQRKLARRIFAEATLEERARMPPFPSSPSTEFVVLARAEAKSEEPRRALRWECILGVIPPSA